jgi:peptidoglycan/xylan/chitin deacetylase (PgdA/CDA1 family)
MHALMYHDVVAGDPDESGFPGPGPAAYKLPWPIFVAHLDGIRGAVSRPPAVIDDLLAVRNTDSPAWSLTFDDGGASMLGAGEELVRRGWRGHFFIITDLIGDSGFLDAAAIPHLRKMGHVVGSHSATHPTRMSSLPDDELRKEWVRSVGALSDLLGEEVRTASVPEGYYARRVATAASKAGITSLFTSEPTRKASYVDGCLVVGRLSIRRTTPVREAAGAAAGRPAPWLRQYAGWNLRKPVKAMLGEDYEHLVAKLRTGRNR